MFAGDGDIHDSWLTKSFAPVEAGVYRANQAIDDDFQVKCSPAQGEPLPVAFINYEEQPREYVLSSIATTLQVDTRISDLFRSPMDQLKEQLTLAVEMLKEKQESELLNNRNYGLLQSVDPDQRIQSRKGTPTPDDLDELITKVWKEPAYFVAHPKAIAAFGRECTRRGVPPPTVTLFGTPFLTWRGVPLIPTDKLHVDGNKKPKGPGGKSNILLLRVGEKKQGVIGLFQPGLPGEQTPGLSVRFMGIDNRAMASYLISLYCSAAV